MQPEPSVAVSAIQLFSVLLIIKIWKYGDSDVSKNENIGQENKKYKAKHWFKNTS